MANKIKDGDNTIYLQEIPLENGGVQYAEQTILGVEGDIAYCQKKIDHFSDRKAFLESLLDEMNAAGVEKQLNID